jgi:hypothetical protein
MRQTHLDCALILSIGLIYVDMSCRTCGELACLFIECDGFEVGFFVNVCGLENVVGPVEYDERIARDVGLTVSFY